MNKEIDWEKLDKEADEELKILSKIDKEIEQERSKNVTIDDLKAKAKVVNEYIEKNKLNKMDIDIKK